MDCKIATNITALNEIGTKLVHDFGSLLGLSPNHDSGLGDSNQIPLFPRSGFDSNHFLMIL